MYSHHLPQAIKRGSEEYEAAVQARRIFLDPEESVTQLIKAKKSHKKGSGGARHLFLHVTFG